MYFIGSDDKALNTPDATGNFKFNGGFVELDYEGLLNNRLVDSAMYNWVQPPSYDSEREVNAYAALLRYYLGDWSAINIAIHGEYIYRITGSATKNKEKQKIKFWRHIHQASLSSVPDTGKKISPAKSRGDIFIIFRKNSEYEKSSPLTPKIYL